jgi:hypothetical protein
MYVSDLLPIMRIVFLQYWSFTEHMTMYCDLVDLSNTAVQCYNVQSHSSLERQQYI